MLKFYLKPSTLNQHLSEKLNSHSFWTVIVIIIILFIDLSFFPPSVFLWESLKNIQLGWFSTQAAIYIFFSFSFLDSCMCEGLNMRNAVTFYNYFPSCSISLLKWLQIIVPVLTVFITWITAVNIDYSLLLHRIRAQDVIRGHSLQLLLRQHTH